MAKAGAAPLPRRNSSDSSRPVSFTSALYLGFTHSAAGLPPWQQLTSGRPSALREDPLTRRLALQLARLQGFADGLAFASTVHLFRDLLDLLSREAVAILVDAGAYPIARWGAERAALQGCPIHTFTHGDPAALRRALRRCRRQRRPIVITDGWCTQCGRAMPLADYLELLDHRDGLLVIDDTQALGLLGRYPEAALPYGHGGGGILPWLDLPSRSVISGASLAKSFGVPMAILGGAPRIVDAVRKRGLTRLHCSPPSLAHTNAAQRALLLNRQQGEELRRRLWHNVSRFRNSLMSIGLSSQGGCFPVQRIVLPHTTNVDDLYRQLTQQHIDCLITSDHQARPGITFLIRADHDPQQLDQTVDRLYYVIRKFSL